MVYTMHSSGNENENHDPDHEQSAKEACCQILGFDGNKTARGLALVSINCYSTKQTVNETSSYFTPIPRQNAFGRGSLVISNIFLSTSLVYLATEAAGCKDQAETCSNRVYGFKPSSLITNIAVVSGILSACFMPLVGAMIDFTPHRRKVGILSAMLLIFIQGLQMFTMSSTWLIMAIVQALAGCVYQVQVLGCLSYKPELANRVGETTMSNYLSKIAFLMTLSQIMFLILIVGLSSVWKTSPVLTAQISQCLSCIWILIAFLWGWKLLPTSKAKHGAQPAHLCTAGFDQLRKTAGSIKTRYRNSLRFFYTALVFAEAAVNTFGTVAVVFQTEHLKLSTTEVGIQFLIVLVMALPGTVVANFVSKRTDPPTSWMLCLLTFSLVTAVASCVLTGPSMKNVSYVFCAFWGLTIGWHYPTENLIFSRLLPKGQESELSGFNIYCAQILVWLPPLLFTAMNEQSVSMQWGLVVLVPFMLVAVGLLHLMAPWDESLEEVGVSLNSCSNSDGVLSPQLASSIQTEPCLESICPPKPYSYDNSRSVVATHIP